MLHAFTHSERARQLSYLQSLAVWIAPPLIVMLVGAAQDIVPLGELTRDPIIVARSVDDCCFVLTGAISNMSASMWIIAASILFFSSLILKTRRENRKASFLFSAGAISAMLGADDLFLIHDEILIALGAPEKGVFLFYVMTLTGFVLIFARECLENRYIALLAAFLLFSIAMAEDVLTMIPDRNLHFFVEDGFKFIGVTCWVYFFAHASRRCIVDTD